MAEKKKIIQKKSKATVSNSLNEMFFEKKDITLQAFRMMMFYLAKIDPTRPEFTEIQVPLVDYAEMLGVELNEDAIDKSTDLLLGYIVKIEPKQTEGSEYEELSNKVQLFTQSKLLRRKKDGELLLTFKCHEELKPHIFNLRSQFTKFEVWNVLNLNNFQDMRMYMLLSQYRTAGERTIELVELKERLGISKDAYSEYKEFARTVLKKCQASLAERTDIRFEFKSVGRPAHSVYFKIYKNDEYQILKYLEEPGRVQLPAGEEQLVYGDGSVQMTISGDPLEHERDARAAICEGFQEEFFDDFSLDQLREFAELAMPHLDKVAIHDLKLTMSFDDARSQVLCDYVKAKILYVRSNGADRSTIGYIRKAIAEDYR